MKQIERKIISLGIGRVKNFKLKDKEDTYKNTTIIPPTKIINRAKLNHLDLNIQANDAWVAAKVTINNERRIGEEE